MKIYNYLKNKAEENKSEEFTLKINIQETKNYFVEKIEQSKLRSKKTQKICTTLNYIEQFLVLASAVTRCISVSAFASLFGIPSGLQHRDSNTGVLLWNI